MSHMILKIGDLDLDLYGQIVLQTSNIFVSTVKNLTISAITFQLVNVSDGFETCDFDLQGQIGLQTCKIFVLNF